MKTARAIACAWYVDCPECGEPIVDQNGSQMFTERASIGVTTGICENCGETSKLPAAVRGVKA